MPITNKNRPLLHQRVAQLMNPPNAGISVTSGSLMVGSDDGLANEIYVQSNTPSNSIYDVEADTFMQIASSGVSIGTGACAYRSPWSNTYTATGGSTTTITYSGNIRTIAVGATVNFLTGANAGRSTTVTEVIVDNATTTLVITAVASAVANTDTFRMNTGRAFVVFGAVQNTFRQYDIATNTWTTLSTIPTTFSTDGRITGVYNFNEAYATGTATAGTTNTLSNSAKTWTVNQWTNYQVRITAGTGLGQIRVIASNTATQLTVATNWTTTPDTTSVYAIEGDEDKLYLAGNSQTTFYRYSISANTWTTLAPTTALTTNRANGMFLHFIGKSNDADWSSESVNKDGRYIWSAAGGGTTTMNRYDIVLNTWVNTITTPTLQSFSSGITTGSMSCVDGRYIYFIFNTTGQIYRFDAVSQSFIPYCNINFLNNSSTLGNRMFLVKMSSDPTVKWIYVYQSPNLLFRQLIY